MAKSATKAKRPAPKKAARKQAGPDSRSIVVRTAFNYTWPSRAVTHYKIPGEYRVKNEVADFAVAKGYATEGKLEEAPADADTADAGAIPPVADQSVADADRPAGGPALDSDAG